MSPNVGLGRIRVEDDRDYQFPASAVVPQTTDRMIRYWWARGLHIFQGRTPWCVDYAAHHCIADGPRTHERPDGSRTGPIWVPGEVYFPAQKVDQWPGENYDGTSGRAAATVLRAMGFITEYRHVFDIDTGIRTVLEEAPLLLGSHWYPSFYDNDREVKEISGRSMGGHETVWNGVNLKRGVARIKNSHSILPELWISLESLERLLREDGDLILLREVKG